MWHWIKRCHGWVMNEILPLYRLRTQSRGLHVSYEKAGLTLHHGTIPWNADAVVVEATLKLPREASRKNDFRIEFPSSNHAREPGGRARSILPETFRRTESDQHQLFFRLPVPTANTTVELFWRTHRIGSTELNCVSEDEYRRALRLDSATVFVRIGDRTVAARTFVSTQSRGLHAVAHLSNPYGLAPLVDLNPRVRFRSDRAGILDEIPICLSSTQLSVKEALISAMPRTFSRRIGSWSIEWLLGEDVLVSRQVKAISQKAFHRSLQVLDTRFVVSNGAEFRLDRHAPPLKEITGSTRVGPCFLIGSSEPGMAGICELQVRAQLPGGLGHPPLSEQELFISDGPAVFAPGTIEADEAAQISAFLLENKGQSLGSLSLRPIPEASFNTEGGFVPPPTFSWSSLADEELQERLNRLLG